MLVEYIESAMAQAVIRRLEDGTFGGGNSRVPRNDCLRRYGRGVPN